MLEMHSREGECVPLAAPVEARGNIEVWLQRLVEGMQVGGALDSGGGGEGVQVGLPGRLEELQSSPPRRRPDSFSRHRFLYRLPYGELLAALAPASLPPPLPALLRLLTTPWPPSCPRQATVKGVIKRAHKEVYEQGLEEFVFGHPAQVALLGLQFQWTADMQVGG